MDADLRGFHRHRTTAKTGRILERVNTINLGSFPNGCPLGSHEVFATRLTARFEWHASRVDEIALALQQIIVFLVWVNLIEL